MPSPDLTDALAAFLAEQREYRRRDLLYDKVVAVASRVERRHDRLQAKLGRMTKRLLHPQSHRTQDAALPLAKAINRAGVAGLVVGDHLVIDLCNTDHQEWAHTVAVISIDKILGLPERLKKGGGPHAGS